jgi:hypothetical protein
MGLLFAGGWVSKRRCMAMKKRTHDDGGAEQGDANASPDTHSYFEAFMPKMYPLYRDPAAIDGARRAGKVHLPAASKLLPLAKLKTDKVRNRTPLKKIKHIADNYWLERRWYERERIPEFASALEALKTATITYKKAIENVPVSVRTVLNRQQLQPALELKSVAPIAIDTILDAVIGVCEARKPPKGKPGAHEKPHIQTGVKELADLWSTLTRKPFPKSVGVAKAKGTEEFVSPGAMFVHQMLAAIDPEVRLAEVRTALKSLPVKGEKVRKTAP